MDQLMAFCVNEDVDRLRHVLNQISPHTPAYAIRRAITEAKMRVDDRRVRFVGLEAYEAEGGPVVRDPGKVCAKMKVRTRIEPVVAAVQLGLIEPE